ncbi:MAG: metal-dependent hydrolase [Desulfovibrionaceae bacterium]|nr:metal-dependent hydrolase [Desulfovibrionaceae bacterium]
MSVSITWYGHSCFRVEEGGVSALIDPFVTGNPSCPVKPEDIPPVDAVLVTHDHGDHVGDAVNLCNRHGALCACVVGTGAALAAKGLKKSLIPAGIGFNIGGSITHKGMTITMTQAFHTTESGSPVGYVLTMPGGFRLYHAGDTGIFAGMELIGELYPLDLALLPCGGFFTMDALQAAHACRLLKAPAMVPMHWGTFPVLAQSTEALKSALAKAAPACRMLEMRPGQSLTL